MVVSDDTKAVWEKPHPEIASKVITFAADTDVKVRRGAAR